MNEIQLLAQALQMLQAYQQSGDRQFLTGARRLAGQALRVLSGGPHRIGSGQMWADGLVTAYAVRGDQEVIDEALDVLHGLLPGSGPDEAAVRTTLYRANSVQFERTRRLEFLQEAADHSRRGMACSPPGSAVEFVNLINLIGALWVLGSNTNDPQLLTEAITLGGRIDDYPDPDRHFLALGLQNYANALRHRAMLHNEVETLREAIRLHRRALADPADARDRYPICLGEYGSTLMIYGIRTDDPAVLDEAIATLRSAVGLLTESVLRANVLSDLGRAIEARVWLGDTTLTYRDAIAAFEQAVRLSREVNPIVHRDMTMNLANGLFIAFRDAGGNPDLLARSFALTDGLRHDPGLNRSQRARVLNGHVRCLMAQRAADPASVGTGEAIRTLREALTLAPDPLSRTFQLGSLGLLLADEGAWAEAADVLEQAIAELHRMASPAHDRSDLERVVSELPGLAAEAAACALMTGDEERAVSLLEYGRGILIGHALALRGDLTELRAADAALHDRLTVLLIRLAAPGASAQLLAGELERLLAHIRTVVPDFWAAPRWADLGPVADEGPVVLLNVSRHRCDALVLQESGISVNPLPASVAEVAMMTERFLAALGSEDEDRILTDTLRWLGSRVVGPALAGVPGGRLWWCPTGPAVWLPLHAAAPEGTVSSYTPTLQALIDARRRSGATPLTDARKLAVGVPDRAPSFVSARLRHAGREVRAFADRFPDAVVLEGQQAGVAAVRAALPGASLVHFACHAERRPGAMSSGRLCLYDGDLDVKTVPELPIPGAALAYLSACSTAQPDEQLPDEPTTPAGSLQIAGYSHVVATLWPVSDAASATVAGRFYEIGWPRDGAGESPAAALHRAVAELRERQPDRPALWAPYVHIGP